MRTLCVVQARLSSTRFPQKALADLNGHPLVWHVVMRAMQIIGVDQVILAVPFGDMLAFAHALDANPTHDGGAAGCVPGPGRRFVQFTVASDEDAAESDVLSRFLTIATGSGATTIMRVTGDCPVIDPAICRKVLELFHASQPCDFVSNDTLISGYPDGFDCAVFSRAALETASAKATDPADREHIECYFKRPENGMRNVTLYNPEPWTGPKKLSIDEPRDLEIVRAWLANQKVSA